VAAGLRLLATIVAPLVAPIAKTGYGSGACLRRGWLPVPVHFYQPIPDPAESSAWTHRTEMPGVDFDAEGQLDLLGQIGAYADECDWPEKAADGYYADNPSFGYSSACLLHAMVRHHRPARVIEVGAGMSTMILDGALSRNGQGELITIDPFPHPVLERTKVAARSVRAPVQEVALDEFTALEAGDLLFIDSSHVVRIGGDVNFLYLEVLPRLAPGVLVHIHDIQLPDEYPRTYFDREHPPRVFWTEQYLLQALLTHSERYRVLLAGYWLQTAHHESFVRAFPRAQEARATTSFYMAA
jgi:predicted O-methyltransferase YrrM